MSECMCVCVCARARVYVCSKSGVKQKSESESDALISGRLASQTSTWLRKCPPFIVRCHIYMYVCKNTYL